MKTIFFSYFTHFDILRLLEHELLFESSCLHAFIYNKTGLIIWKGRVVNSYIEMDTIY